MRLGLIAMSGVRTNNPELTALGLSMPSLAARRQTILHMPSLGLLTLAALTPPDIEIEYLEVPDLNEVDGLPGEFDAVAISSFTAQIKDAYALADRYRAAGSLVLLGGLHVSARPAEATLHADCIVIGEGESVWPQVSADLGAGTLKPVYDARSQSFDLAAAPTPRFELLDVERYNRLPVQTQRGCPYNCDFCAASLRIARGYKIKPIEKVLTEIRFIKQLWPRPFIEFADDNTFVNKRHSKQLMRALIRERIHWFSESDVSVAEDEELLDLMRDAGCAQVLIGFESPSAGGLDGIEMHANWKARQLDRYHGAIERIQRRGISVNGCFVLGLDGTGKESFDEVFAFVRDSGLSDVQLTVMTAFPGAPLYERLSRTGRLIDPEGWETCTLFDVNFVPERMTVAELERGFRILLAQIYSDGATQARRVAHRRRIIEARRSRIRERRQSRCAKAG